MRLALALLCRFDFNFLVSISILLPILGRSMFHFYTPGKVRKAEIRLSYFSGGTEMEQRGEIGLNLSVPIPQNGQTHSKQFVGNRRRIV